MRSRSSKALWTIWIPLILLVLFLLSPYLRTGFYNDDALNSLLEMNLRHTGRSFWSQTSEILLSWLKGAGRFYPLGQLCTYTLWHYVLHELPVCRALQWGALLANLWLFYFLVRTLLASRVLGALACLFAAGLFQLRPMHDPIASYGLLMQNLFLLTFGSVLAFVAAGHSAGHAAGRGRPRLFLVLSAVLFALALSFYELAVTALPAILLVWWFNPRRNWRTLVPFAAIAAAYAVTTLALRFSSPMAYAGTRLSVSPKMLTSYLFQLTSALPLSHAVFGRSGFFTMGTLFSAPLLSFAGFAALAAAWLVVRRLLARRRRENPQATPRGARRCALWLGVLLVVFPPAFVAVSERFQQEVARPGVAYLPVYFSYFGVALLLALWTERLRPRGRAAAVWVPAIAAFVLTLNWACNSIAAEKLNLFWKYPRELIDGAARIGFFAPFPETAMFLHATRYHPWMNPVYLKERTGREFDQFNVDDAFHGSGASVLEIPSKDPLLHYLAFLPAGPDSGLVAACRIDRVFWEPGPRLARDIRCLDPIRVALLAPSGLPPDWKARALAPASAPGWYLGTVPAAGVNLRELQVSTPSRGRP